MSETAAPILPPAFKEPQINLYVSDIERSLRFYRDLLGFIETFRTPKDGPPVHVELQLGPLKLGVVTVEALKRDHGISGGGGPPRAEVVLWVDDVDAAYSWLTAKGVPSLSLPHNFGGILRGAWVGDPDGNLVQIVNRRAQR
ncbi:MAG: VOC family protein [Nitrososphaerota archaeon]|nr:VOC family protein [Nitrososphaerota archaeon]MDG7013843.1 VOC family protein [Nitrososphaerota archaeon]MDG7025186.1 VOC family protein [Nitrososphaerota archaeon]